MARDPVPLAWIRTLASPYLRGYRARLERGACLRGYWFLHPRSRSSARKKARRKGSKPVEALGFFVGYLIRGEGYEYLHPQPPECLVFVLIEPVGGPTYRRLVEPTDSLLRKTHEYIGWLTHRPPRFVFPEQEEVVLVRHNTMREWPPAKFEHYSRNFFIEAMAWLVRSGLVRKLLAERLQGSAGLNSDAVKK